MTHPPAPRSPMLARLLPQPALALLLLVVWMLASNRVSAGVLLMGTVLAVGIPLLIARLGWPQAPTRIRWRPLLSLAGVVLVDIVVANVRVAVQILGPPRKLRPGFFEVPLDIEQPFTIAALAGVITLTPGSMTVAVSQDQRRLLIHALHIDNVPDEITHIKQRYERRLQEVFE